MKTNHTPGPWTIEGNGILLHPVSMSPLKTTRLDLAGWGRVDILDESNTPEENARLIAAAPDLLAALEEAELDMFGAWQMLSAICESDGGNDRIKARDNARAGLTKIRAAIAKAEGREG